jgi:hypothetical protein
MTVKDSGLVAGVKLGDKDDELTIKVLRGFMREGEPVAIGSVLTLPVRFARALIAMNKAELVAAPEAEPEDKTAEDEESPKRHARAAKAKE